MLLSGHGDSWDISEGAMDVRRRSVCIALVSSRDAREIEPHVSHPVLQHAYRMAAASSRHGKLFACLQPSSYNRVALSGPSCGQSTSK